MLRSEALLAALRSRCAARVAERHSPPYPFYVTTGKVEEQYGNVTVNADSVAIHGPREPAAA